MLNHPTLEKLQSLKLTGMLKALEEQMQMPESETLSFEERQGLLIDRESTERDNRRLKTRLKKVKLRQNATLEDINYRHPRRLDKSLMLFLAGCQWIPKHHNCIITHPIGAGKTYLACATEQKACREEYSVIYQRLPRPLEQLAVAKDDGPYTRVLTTFERTDLIVLDD